MLKLVKLLNSSKNIMQLYPVVTNYISSRYNDTRSPTGVPNLLSGMEYLQQHSARSNWPHNKPEAKPQLATIEKADTSIIFKTFPETEKLYTFD
jgi:hypothetical protein